jgi:hypothetical protein
MEYGKSCSRPVEYGIWKELFQACRIWKMKRIVSGLQNMEYGKSCSRPVEHGIWNELFQACRNRTWKEFSRPVEYGIWNELFQACRIWNSCTDSYN